MSNWAAIVAVDPGRVTGVARGVFPIAGIHSVQEAFAGAREVEAWECDGPPGEQADEIVSEADDWFIWQNIRGLAIPDCHTVVESFRLRTKQADLSPVELLALIRNMWDNRLSAWPDIIEQTPSDAKSFATNARLRLWDAWQVGSEHRRDAMRHVALRVSRLLE